VLTHESDFNGLVIKREHFKRKVESTIEPFITTCQHQIHTKCLKPLSSMPKLKIYEGQEFPCSFCKSTVDLALPIFHRDLELFALPLPPSPPLLTNPDTPYNPLYSITQTLKHQTSNLKNFLSHSKTQFTPQTHLELQIAIENLDTLSSLSSTFQALNQTYIDRAILMATNDKTLIKYSGFVEGSLNALRCIILYTDLIGLRAMFKNYVKNYSILLSCLRKSLLLNLYGNEDAGVFFEEH
jgi:hypothetical protein